jgi:hypothetical protein
MPGQLLFRSPNICFILFKIACTIYPQWTEYDRGCPLAASICHLDGMNGSITYLMVNSEEDPPNDGEISRTIWRIYGASSIYLYTIYNIYHLELERQCNGEKRVIDYDPTTPGGLSGNPTKFRSLLNTLTVGLFPPNSHFSTELFRVRLGERWTCFSGTQYRLSRSEGLGSIAESL